MFDRDYGYDIKDYGYIGVSALGWGPADYTEKQIDKLMREEGLMETKELTNGLDNPIKETKKGESNEMKLTKEELEKIAAEIRLAAGLELDNPIKENTENTKVEEVKVSNEGVKEKYEQMSLLEDDDIVKLNKEKEEKEERKSDEDKKTLARTLGNKEEIKENRLKPVVNKVEKKGRKGIRVKGFRFNIATTTNSAIYDSFVAFHGTKNDSWLVWGRFNGTLEKDVNGQKEANFEFFLFENGKLIVTYWKAENYKIVAEKLAKAAIKRLLEANVR